MNERRGTSEAAEAIHQFYQLEISWPALFRSSATATPSFLSGHHALTLNQTAGHGSNQSSLIP